MPGMIMSSSIRWGACSDAMASASSPLSAVMTSYPWRESRALTTRRLAGWSSTTRMLPDALAVEMVMPESFRCPNETECDVPRSSRYQNRSAQPRAHGHWETKNAFDPERILDSGRWIRQRAPFARLQRPQLPVADRHPNQAQRRQAHRRGHASHLAVAAFGDHQFQPRIGHGLAEAHRRVARPQRGRCFEQPRKRRSEEHTSELQSLMRNSYAVFCLKKKK